LAERVKSKKRHREEKLAKSGKKKKEEQETQILARRKNGKGRSYLIKKGAEKKWYAASRLGDKWKEKLELFDATQPEDQEEHLPISSSSKHKISSASESSEEEQDISAEEKDISGKEELSSKENISVD
jgi:hypothetical protein